MDLIRFSRKKSALRTVYYSYDCSHFFYIIKNWIVEVLNDGKNYREIDQHKEPEQKKQCNI